MHCPNCKGEASAVRFSKDVGTHIMRWHVCKSCDTSFETHEVHVVPAQPHSVQTVYAEDAKLAAMIDDWQNEEG